MNDPYSWDKLSVNERLKAFEEFVTSKYVETNYNVWESLELLEFDNLIFYLPTYTLGTKEANEREHEGSNKT